MEECPTTGTGSGAQVHRQVVDARARAVGTRKTLVTVIDRTTRMCRVEVRRLPLVGGDVFWSCHASEEVSANRVRHRLVARSLDRGAP